MPTQQLPMSRLDNLPAVRTFTDLKLAAGAAADAFLVPHTSMSGPHMQVRGRDMVNFVSYNYVGTNSHPDIAAAVAAAVEQYGTSVSASRLVGGQIPLHTELEHALASFLGVDDAVCLVGGHATNVTLLGALLSDRDLIVYDSLAHNSIRQGAALSRARRASFPHSDVTALRELLERRRGDFDHVLVVVEGVYSMDGDIVPLPELLTVTEEFDAMIMVDEAHSLGVIGPGGRGVAAHFGIDPRRIDIHMGTLSKALNSCGGYIAGSAKFVDWMKHTLPGFVFSVGLSPANTAAALESLRLLIKFPHLSDVAVSNTAELTANLRSLGVDTGLAAGSAIVPWLVGSSAAANQLSVAFAERGVHVAPVVYPAVPDGQARLRFFVSAAHQAADLELTTHAAQVAVAQLR